MAWLTLKLSYLWIIFWYHLTIFSNSVQLSDCSHIVFDILLFILILLTWNCNKIFISVNYYINRVSWVIKSNFREWFCIKKDNFALELLLVNALYSKIQGMFFLKTGLIALNFWMKKWYATEIFQTFRLFLMPFFRFQT